MYYLCCQMLGHKGAFIGKIGDDMFGNQLTYAIKEVGIDTTGLKRDSQVHTTLAFVHTLEDGDRSFHFTGIRERT